MNLFKLYIYTFVLLAIYERSNFKLIIIIIEIIIITMVSIIIINALRCLHPERGNVQEPVEAEEVDDRSKLVAINDLLHIIAL